MCRCSDHSLTVYRYSMIRETRATKVADTTIISRAEALVDVTTTTIKVKAVEATTDVVTKEVEMTMVVVTKEADTTMEAVTREVEMTMVVAIKEVDTEHSKEEETT